MQVCTPMYGLLLSQSDCRVLSVFQLLYNKSIILHEGVLGASSSLCTLPLPDVSCLSFNETNITIIFLAYAVHIDPTVQRRQGFTK